MQLDPDDLRRFAARDWEAPARLARKERARMPVEQKIALAVELYEAAAALGPHDAARRADYEAHVRLNELMKRAANVGAR